MRTIRDKRRISPIYLVLIIVFGVFIYSSKRSGYLKDMSEYEKVFISKVENQEEHFNIKVKTPFNILNSAEEQKESLEASIENAKESWVGTMHNVNLGDISVEAEYNLLGANIVHNIEYKNTKKDLQSIDKYIDKFIKDNINQNMSDYDKIKEAYIYTIESFTYGSGNGIIKDRNVLLGLKGQPIVCEAYSFLLHRLAEEMQIESKIVWGVVDNVDHTWNMVKIDGNWLHVDPTWGDSPDGSVNMDYFLLPERKMLRMGDRIMEGDYPSSITSIDKK